MNRSTTARAVYQLLSAVVGRLRDSVMDLLPIVVVIAAFQLLVLQQPIPNAGTLLLGTLFVVIGDVVHPAW